MIRKFFSVLMVLLIMCLFTGCSFSPDKLLDALPDKLLDALPDKLLDALPGEQPDESATDSKTDETTPFSSYNLKVNSSELAVRSGPGYSYDTVSYITDRGTYLIVAEEIERLAGGDVTVWGRISGIGWINLEEAQADPVQTDPSTEPLPVAETSAATEPADDVFEPYVFALNNPWVEIYSGPGYHYYGVDSIKGGGAFTIVEEAVQYFDSGRSVTWGRLKSGAGWICLDDAALDTESGPPYRCTECGRADVSISRHALCDDCYNKLYPAPYGYCTNCGDPLTYDEYCKPWSVCDDCPTDYGYDECLICGDILTDDEIQDNDGIVCNDCLVCGFCGDHITMSDVTAFSSYICWPCYEREYCCSVCGADCFNRGLVDGMCWDCYAGSTDYCIDCGVELNEWNTDYNGFGRCVDCYYKNLDPEYICDICGADCSFRGSYDGLCEDCYNATH